MTFKHFNLLFYLLLGTLTYGQEINIDYKNGTQSKYKIEDIRKITFTDEAMNLHLFDGSLFSWNFNSIKTVGYNETPLNNNQIINIVNYWNLSLYPNPASNTINISFNLSKIDDVIVTIFDLNGVLIQEYNLGKTQLGLNTFSIDISNLKNGSYLIKIHGNNSVVTKKIIKI